MLLELQDWSLIGACTGLSYPVGPERGVRGEESTPSGTLVLARRARFFSSMSLILSDSTMWRLETLRSLMIPKHELELVLLGEVGLLELNTGIWSPVGSGRDHRDERGVVGGWSSLELLLSFSTVLS